MDRYHLWTLRSGIAAGNDRHKLSFSAINDRDHGGREGDPARCLDLGARSPDERPHTQRGVKVSACSSEEGVRVDEVAGSIRSDHIDDFQRTAPGSRRRK